MPRKPPKKELPQIDAMRIAETSEYDVFSRLPGNRAVSEAHVKNLMERMREKDLKVPIQVNQDFQVIDGQHRLEARRRLGFPVYYYWEENLQLRDVQALNSSSKGWTSDDYCKAYIELGYRDYETYTWFRGKYGLPHKSSAALLESGGPTKGLSDRFKNGEFRVKDLEGAKRKAEMLNEIRPYFPNNWKNESFVSAFLVVLGREGFEFKTLMHRIKQNPGMLTPCRTHDQYLQLIEAVYNYKAINKVPLRFGRDAKPTANHISAG